MRLLLVEDDRTFQDWVRLLLQDGPDACSVAAVGSISDALDELRRSEYDLVLLDLLLPDSEGLEGLGRLAQSRPEQPIVVLTGAPEEQLALAAIDHGAHDYLEKDSLDRASLRRALRHAVARVGAERRRRAAESRLRLVSGHTVDLVTTLDEQGRFTYVSGTARTVLDRNPSRLVGTDWRELVLDEDRDQADQLWRRASDDPPPEPLRVRLRHGSEEDRWYELRLSRPLEDGGTDDVPFVLVIRDSSGRVALEEQLAHSVRFATVGHLASGTAHDFNNLLTVIASRSGVLRSHLQDDPPSLLHLAAIDAAVDRGRGITENLLALGRREPRTTAVIHPPEAVTDLWPILETATPRGVVLKSELDAAVPRVRMHPTEFDQVLLNLVLNAVDAVQGNGHILVRVEPARRATDGRLGCRVSVEDDGIGMDAATVAQATQPLFTTKHDDRGSGLGLSSSSEIVDAARGELSIESERGVGTQVRVWLPAVEETASAAATPLVVRGPDDAWCSVLVVDDRRELLDLTTQLLELERVRTVAAATSDEARRAFVAHADLDAVLCDLHLDETSGIDLVGEFRAVVPELPVVLFSGHLAPDLSPLGLPQATEFVRKPFSTATLVAALRRVTGLSPTDG